MGKDETVRVGTRVPGKPEHGDPPNGHSESKQREAEMEPIKLATSHCGAISTTTGQSIQARLEWLSSSLQLRGQPRLRECTLAHSNATEFSTAIAQGDHGHQSSQPSHGAVLDSHCNKHWKPLLEKDEGHREIHILTQLDQPTAIRQPHQIILGTPETEQGRLLEKEDPRESKPYSSKLVRHERPSSKLIRLSTHQSALRRTK